MAQKLLLEGKNDVYVVSELCKKHLPSPKGYASRRKFENDFIEEIGGVGNLVENINTIFKSGDLEHFGIIVDADNDISARWDSIKGVLIENGYVDLPKGIDVNGIIIEQEDKPIVGVWLMPNNQNTGYLENFYESMIKEGDDLLVKADEVVQNLLDEELNRFRAVEKQKVKIHTWLAWQKQVAMPMGTSIKDGRVNSDSPLALRFISWMKRTFEFSEN